jgi:PAS domain S-box-containing protein
MEDANFRFSRIVSENLKEKDKFRIIIESAPVGIGEISLEPPSFRWINKATCNILEYTEEELIKVNPFDLIAEESKSVFQERLNEILAGKKIVPSVDYQLKTKNGRLIWTSLNINLLQKDGKVVGGLVFAQDITQRKKAEAELKESEERFFKAFRLNPTPMAIAHVNGEFIDVNTSFERLMGFARDEVIGKRGVSLRMYSETSEREELIRKLQQDGHVYNFEMTFNTKSMKPVNVLFSLEQIKLQNEPRVLGAAVDVAEKKRLQSELEKYVHNLEELVKQKTQQLVETERLSTIGQCAGMVGHDIRNPLQAISSEVYLLKSDLESMPEGEAKEGMKESLAGVEENVRYANKIVQDLQDFARPLTAVAKEVDIRKILCADAFFKNKFPENIGVSCRVNREAEKLVTDPDMLKRIVHNLVSNAVQAMPDGGKLDVYAYKEADDTVIIVQDTGVGIPEAIRPRLFKPLVTTKSRGQGFGLAVVRRMTEALGGTITYESEVGKGTKFILRLPFRD